MTKLNFMPPTRVPSLLDGSRPCKRRHWLALASGVVLLGLASPSARAVVVLSNLISFNHTNGYNPTAPLLQALDGNFYGTTAYGGADPSSGGTLFQLTPGGSFSNLLSFNVANGANPTAGLIQGSDGNFYGTTAHGGAFTNADPYHFGYGTVFQFTTNYTLNVLASFNNTNGAIPTGLIQASNGFFYGLSTFGGTNTDQYGNTSGAIFKADTNGLLTSLFSFDHTNGASPAGTLTLGTDGNFYGTTTYGGMAENGAAFQLTTNGSFSLLASFYDITNGSGPNTLTMGRDGNLYGTTVYGGIYHRGTIFQMTTNGTVTTLATFTGTNGTAPSQLIQAMDGSFLGVTSQGGASNAGTVFELTTNGTLGTLYAFSGGSDGRSGTSIMQGSDGNFYGTTSYGGDFGFGNVFKLSLVPTPVFQSVIQTNGAITFTWAATAGQNYEVQYKTDLTAANWTHLQSVTAASATATATDATGPDLQRLYRVVLLVP